MTRYFAVYAHLPVPWFSFDADTLDSQPENITPSSGKYVSEYVAACRTYSGGGNRILACLPSGFDLVTGAQLDADGKYRPKADWATRADFAPRDVGFRNYAAAAIVGGHLLPS